jgi:transmembrane sensor
MKDLRNTNNCNDELLAGYLAGEAGNNEKLLVESLISGSEDNKREFEESLQVMENAVLFYKTRQFNAESAWKSVRSRMKQQPQPAEVQGIKKLKTGLTSLLKYAAILVFAAVAGTTVYFLAFRKSPSSLIEIQSAGRVIGEYILPDGTRVALNSNSVIRFPEKFSGNTRNVSIEGEAFFDVVPDSTKPFIISAGKASVKVLGTSFNVSAYPGKEMVEVVVKTGKVHVAIESGSSGGSAVVLKPGEKGTLFTANEQLVKSVNTDLNFLAWKTRMLIFRETKMADVIRTLEKTYTVKINTSQPAIDSLILSAQFDEQPVNYVLDVIRLTFRLHLKSDNGQYTLSYSVN